MRLWGSDGTQRRILTGHTHRVHAFAVAPDGRWLASGSHDGTVRLWNADGAHRATTSGSSSYDSVETVAIAPNGQWLVSGGTGSRLYLWGADGTLLVDYYIQTWIRCTALAPDGRWLVTVDIDGKVAMLEIRY